MSAPTCPTCGPTTTEQHPRHPEVLRCHNCKEWLLCKLAPPHRPSGTFPRVVTVSGELVVDRRLRSFVDDVVRSGLAASYADAADAAVRALTTPVTEPLAKHWPTTDGSLDASDTPTNAHPLPSATGPVSH